MPGRNLVKGLRSRKPAGRDVGKTGVSQIKPVQTEPNQKRLGIQGKVNASRVQARETRR